MTNPQDSRRQGQSKGWLNTGERLMALLPATSRELLDKLGVSSTSTLHKWISRLREAKKIRIGRWLRGKGDFVAVYVRGSSPDAPRPKRYTEAEIQKRYRERLKIAGLYEDYLADMRRRGAKYRLRKGQKPYTAQAFDPLLKLFYRKI